MTMIPMDRVRRIGLTTLVAGSILIGSGAVFAQDSESTSSTPTTTSEDTGQDSSMPKERSSSSERQHGRSSGMTSQLASAVISPADAVTTATAEVDGSLVAFGTGDVDGEPTYVVQIDDQLITISAVSGDVLDTQAVQRGGPSGRMSNRNSSDQSGDQSEASTANESETAMGTPTVTESDATATTSEPTELETLLLSTTVSPADAVATAETASGESAQTLQLRRHDGTVVYVIQAENSEVIVDATTGQIRETTIRTIYISDDESTPNESEVGTPAG
ncbi:MAG: PepSY domain-containing protein [Thermomicrobiales bacterium]|nr:PepSY domain-containing protein [Thermomicrobiales bacterium]